MNDLLVEAAVRTIEALAATAGLRDERLDGEVGVIRQGLKALSDSLADAGAEDTQQPFGLGRALRDEVTAALERAASELRDQGDEAERFS